MSLRGVGSRTVEIVRAGAYTLPSGEVVSIQEEVRRALEGTRLYRPADLPLPCAPKGDAAPRIEVTPETTGAAARRLVEQESVAHVLALNFASAKNAGGGFLGGAKAQEEDLARCSALYECQISQPTYYSVNRAVRSLVYTDHMIYSPDVPFFRDERLDLLTRPFLVSIITAPAPNAGELSRQQTGSKSTYREALFARTVKVLSVAAAHGHRTLVLGAWGCGVFRNDPVLVAEAFATGLEQFRGCFDRVVFAVYDRKEGTNLKAFQARFG